MLELILDRRLGIKKVRIIELHSSRYVVTAAISTKINTKDTKMDTRTINR